MITAWRITKNKFQDSAFTGEGAEIAGGRWNSQGTRMVYASSSVSLAVLEILVHLNSSVLPSYILIPFSFDEKLAAELEVKDLPKGWAAHPPPVASQQIGDGWVHGQTSQLLKVPSVVVPLESNYLLNPAHPDADKIKIGKPIPLPLDERLTRLVTE
jgi:RES domain-containing protein